MVDEVCRGDSILEIGNGPTDTGLAVCYCTCPSQYLSREEG